MELTRIAIVAIVFIALLLVFLTKYYWEHPEDRTIIHNYLSALSGLGILMVLITFVASSYYQDIQLSNSNLDTVNEIRRNLYSDIQKYYIDNYPYLNRLYGQLFSSSNIPQPDVTDTLRQESLEIFLMGDLLQTVEEVYSLNKEVGWSNGVWLAWYETFKSWFQSPLLLAYWKKNSKYYDPAVNRFIYEIIRGVGPFASS